MSRILTTSQKSAFQPLVTLGPVKPSRSFRFGYFEQTRNATAFLAGTQKNGSLCIKVNARNGIQTFPKESSTVQTRFYQGPLHPIFLYVYASFAVHLTMLID